MLASVVDIDGRASGLSIAAGFVVIHITVKTCYRISLHLRFLQPAPFSTIQKVIRCSYWYEDRHTYLVPKPFPCRAIPIPMPSLILLRKVVINEKEEKEKGKECFDLL